MTFDSSEKLFTDSYTDSLEKLVTFIVIPLWFILIILQLLDTSDILGVLTFYIDVL